MSGNSLPMSWPHAACVRHRRFRRAWVVPALTEANWDRSGVVYRSDEGEVVYGTVLRFEQHGVTQWQISRHLLRDGRLRHTPSDLEATRPAAIERLMAEVHASRARFGAVPREEWPEDADSPWVVYSVPRTPRGDAGS